MKRIYSIAVLFAALISNGAYAGEMELWSCYDNAFLRGEVILTAAGLLESETGVVIAAGKRNMAYYHVEGFQRRWDFSESKTGYDYSFLISPNGYAKYYDFSRVKGGELAKPEIIMYCKKIPVKEQ